MGRPLRIEQDDAWYHVINRGAAHQTIFFEERDRADFERLLGIAHERFGLRVHSYCLMTNHYHLLVDVPCGGLSPAMQLIGSNFVRHVNERQGRDGPLFHDRFYSKLVTDDAYLTTVVRYIHRNPLAFIDERDLRRYRHSSLRSFLGDRRPPPWMETRRVLDLIGGVDAFERLVMGHEVDTPTLSVALLPDLIDLVLDEMLDERAGPHVPRTVLVLLSDRLDGCDRNELLDTLAFPTPQAQRAALSRARRRGRDDPDLVAIVERVLLLAGRL
jgi:REP element-mobilizing transposase RayT